MARNVAIGGNIKHGAAAVATVIGAVLNLEAATATVENCTLESNEGFVTNSTEDTASVYGMVCLTTPYINLASSIFANNSVRPSGGLRAAISKP